MTCKTVRKTNMSNDRFKIMSCKKQAVPRVMQKNKLFHMSCHAKNKLFHMSCKNHAKPCEKQAVPHVMQKPCKNHAKCGAYGAPTRRTLTVPRVLAIRAICAIWVSQGKPLNIHSPRVPCYMCHRVPCYMCYMCYMALYSTYTTDFRAYRIYSTYRYSKELGESRCSAAWRVRYSTYSTYSKEPGDCGGSAAWRTRGTVPQQIGSALSAVGGRIPHCGQL